MLSRSALTSAVCAAALAAQCTVASAQETVRTYIVTSVSQTGAGVSSIREVLTLEADGDRSRVRVSSADGSISIPVALTAQGQIASASQDRSVTCYNMAMGVLAHQGSASEPASVFVQFFSSVVEVPLVVRATREQGGLHTIALEGTSAGLLHAGTAATDAGIVINATVDEESGTLHEATFDEAHYVGVPTQIVGRSTCAIRRAEDRTGATTRA